MLQPKRPIGPRDGGRPTATDCRNGENTHHACTFDRNQAAIRQLGKRCVTFVRRSVVMSESGAGLGPQRPALRHCCG